MSIGKVDAKVSDLDELSVPVCVKSQAVFKHVGVAPGHADNVPQLNHLPRLIPHCQVHHPRSVGNLDCPHFL